jgi:hypothetical protein
MKLTSLHKLLRVKSSLFEYVSFNIRTYYCFYERLIYYSNRDRIKFNQTEPSSRAADLILHPYRQM